MRRALPTLLAATLAVAGCDPFQTGFSDAEEAVLYEAADVVDAPAPDRPLRVMTYNIKYGGARLRFFWECRGTRYHMTEAEVLANMEAMAARIRAYDPDILILQEIDSAQSKRAAYVDQVQFLLDHTALSYGAYASQWLADYVPSDGIGPMDSGNAILSRWPVDEATRHALPLIGDDDPLTQYFYLKRNVLSVRTQIPTVGELWIVGTHAEAFSSDGTKQKHIDRFREVLDELDAAGRLFVAGGDLNAVPDGSPVRKDFSDDLNCEDARFEGDGYEGEERWLDGLYAYEPAVPLELFQQNPQPHYTFTGDESVPPNRKLDYLFTNADFVDGSGDTLQDALLLSDHVPVVAELEVTP